jgi:hypothetical protein
LARLLSMPPGAVAEPPDAAYIINSIAPSAQHVS